MAKIKSSDTLSLDKSKQKKVVKQTKQIKKKIQDGKISLKRPRKLVKANVEQNRGLIYIGHIPHGFYEDEMKKYFKQFGAVSNVKVCRSNKTGNSKGFGYVEFQNTEVAKIAAETMNNYLMFKKRVVAEYVPSEKRPKCLFKGKASTVKKNSSKTRREKQRVANLNISDEIHLKRNRERLSKLDKKLQKLKKLGIEYDFKPAELPERIQKNEKIEAKEETHIFQQDPYDSDIEVKVPIKRKSDKQVISTFKRTPKKTPKVTPADTHKVMSKKSPKSTPKQSPRTALKQTPKSSRKESAKKLIKRKVPQK